MTLFRNKYRIGTTRLKGWDYASDGWYFITICARERAAFFGDIVSGEIHLSEIGVIAADEWQRTPALRRNVILDEWVVMPNHLHAIILIDNKITSEMDGHGGTIGQTHSAVPVETHCNASLPMPQQAELYRNTFGPQTNNLAAIIRGFKGSTTRLIHTSGHTDFAWQARYYDHIIRDERSLERVRQYIILNPEKWSRDRDNPANLWM
jgi:putative transposase